jgi:hypothetical protein
VEYRAATGRDAWLADDSNYRDLAAGVLVRRVNPTDDRRSLLLDATPSAASAFSSDWHQVLPVGGALTVASGQWSVQVDAVSSAGAAVSVLPAGGGQLEAPGPVQVLSPAEGARVASGTVTVTGTGTAPEGTLQYEVVGENGSVARGFTNAGANGEPGTFRLSVTLPSGSWTVAVWVGDDSDGESGRGPRPGEVRRSFVVG